MAHSSEAAFVISIDTEMAWGLVHRPEQTYRYEQERADLDRLLDLFDHHNIPATWAVVGHLFLSSCRPVDGVKHPEIVRPEYDWFHGDWFADDPCSSVDADPIWYGPDVVESIRTATARHEIASHGFSHIIAGDPGCSRESFASEVQASLDAAASVGATLRSMVHPRNRIGHVDVLAEQGFVAYRGRRDVVAPSGLGDRVVDMVTGSERTTVRPLYEDGIWNLPATVLFDVDARPRTWRLWIRQMERRLDQAVANGSLFHLWFHPHNLRDRPEASFAALDRICAAAARHRSAGRLKTLTMGSLADQLNEQMRNQRQPVSAQLRTDNGDT